MEEIMWTRWGRRACFLVAAGVSLLGCKPPESGEALPDARDPGGDSPDAFPGSPVLALPLTISDYFVPGGYMGDGAISTTAIMVQTTTCRQPRPSGAAGDCYWFTYRPAVRSWAGIYWQYPEKNWGANPGKQIEAGATKVTFHAAGATGREVIQFIAGGENDVNLPYHDSFTATKTVALTTSVAQYQIDITGKSYEPGVLGAFAWSVGVPPGSTAPVEFYLDTIRWEK
ncbi:MAG TPA: hypothetical protein VGD37_04070 [Kofleriaceae bacterium]